MNIANLFRRPQTRQPAVMAAPAGRTSLSGRPTYTSGTGAPVLLPQAFSHALAWEAYRNVPLIKRSIEVLAGLVGDPELVGSTQRQTDDLEAWSDSVGFGRIGKGLCAFLEDHIAQALLYGYAVGEAEIAAPRNGVNALWSYLSPFFQFRSDAFGNIEILQLRFGLLPLSQDTAFVSTHNPRGSSPQGESMFFSAVTAATTWSEVLFAHRSTWRRTGSPSYAVKIIPPDGLDDPTGDVGDAALASYESTWNEAIRSSVENGVVKDHFWWGNVEIQTIGGDVQAMQFEVSNRALLEQIVLCTGIPPFMLGLTWSTTERMSDQQANTLTATVQGLRRSVEPNIRKVIDLHLRLTGRVQEYTLEWEETSLFDRLSAAQADFAEAQAQVKDLEWATGLWKAGIWNQEQVAEHCTGVPDVDKPMDEPPAAPLPVAQPQDSSGDQAAVNGNGALPRTAYT